jgi:ABC-type transport system substrate-binding protein
MRRLRWLWALLLALPLIAAAEPAAPSAPKVLRYAFPTAETGFDPAQISDIYSRTITPHIFEGLYTYDHLARPIKFKPLTADGMPQASDDFRTWTVRLQRGITFADDPAFQGRRRELVAEDYVYAFKRFADPKINSPAWTFLEQYNFPGLAELRQRALGNKTPFNYDQPIEGIRALDRYTLRFVVPEPRPRLIELLAAGDLFGAVAREVVEAYGQQIPEHPVGTGPFMLKQWRRSSLIVLERNPNYREVFYDAEPAADDAQGQALLARFKGRRLPMIDRVEVSIINEEQPRWLSFLNRQADAIEVVPAEFVNVAMPGGKLAPNLARRGVQGWLTLSSVSMYTLFNMESPIVGGYTPDKVALRRALGLAFDVDREIALLRGGRAIVAHSPVMPNTSGYDPAFISEGGEYSPARAKALLDMYGYIDRDGDGWRDMPDGSPLVIEMATQADQLARKTDELFRKSLDAIQVRVTFRPAQWPENLKAARAGKLMVWSLGLSAAGPDGQESLQRYHSRQIDGQNMARFNLPAFDAIYERMEVLPDGPERLALFEQAKKLAIAYAPYKIRYFRIATDLAQPWLIGYRRPLFWQDWWQMVDVDMGRRAQP